MRRYGSGGPGRTTSRTTSRCAGTTTGGTCPGRRGSGRRDGGPGAERDRLVVVVIIGHDKLRCKGLRGCQSRQVRHYQGWPSE